ncbi:unnamed protein product [Protopolystoma xenopodis]|uniref:Uncharacterized protein n=1 Tax=Protopolystoma xenopodis TaxID=117903 RepID=A0A3S5A5V9_9PLAT|nr:unnamed protein product [Protopolystoma xenopodis]
MKQWPERENYSGSLGSSSSPIQLENADFRGLLSETGHPFVTGWDLSALSMLEARRLIHMNAERSFIEPSWQVNGVVVIIDFTLASAKHIKEMVNRNDALKVAKILQVRLVSCLLGTALIIVVTLSRADSAVRGF